MGEAISVRVLSVSRVAPRLPPPAESGGGGGHVKLSFLDVPWVKLPALQRVFLYELPRAGADGSEFSAVVTQLKESLAASLALYLPLAGKLVNAVAGETGEYGCLAVDCSDAAVAFIEAEVVARGRGEADAADVRRLARDEELDIPAFLGLVPDLGAPAALPSRVLSVQVTRLGGGRGLALGLSVLHAVVDGSALWRFTEAWASASREGSPVTEILGPPHYGREAVFHPRGEEFTREMLQRAVAPELPSAVDLSQGLKRVARRTFYLSRDDVVSLKRRIDRLASAEEDRRDGEAAAPGTTTAKPVSTFVALSALCWTAFVRSKGLAAGADTYLMFPADLRARLDPPVGDGYLGNCVSSCLASADAGQLLAGAGEAALLRAARAIRAAVAEMEAAPLDGMVRWMEQLREVPFERAVCVVASPRFRVYEASDFGFGRPARVELVSMIQDGQVVLGGGKRDGEVQLSVSLHPACMDAFKALALS